MPSAESSALVCTLAAVLVLLVPGCIAPCGEWHGTTSSLWMEPDAYAAVKAQDRFVDVDERALVRSPALPGSEGLVRARMRSDGPTVFVAFEHNVVRVLAVDEATAQQREAAFRAAWPGATHIGDQAWERLRGNFTVAASVRDPADPWGIGPATGGFQDLGPGTESWTPVPVDWDALLPRLGAWTPAPFLGSAAASNGSWTGSFTSPVVDAQGQDGKTGWTLRADSMGRVEFAIDVAGTGDVSAAEARTTLAAAFTAIGRPVPPPGRAPDAVLRADDSHTCS